MVRLGVTCRVAWGRTIIYVSVLYSPSTPSIRLHEADSSFAKISERVGIPLLPDNNTSKQIEKQVKGITASFLVLLDIVMKFSFNVLYDDTITGVLLRRFLEGQVEVLPL